MEHGVYLELKIFDHDAEYTDDEMRQFFKHAETDDELRKSINKFFYGPNNVHDIVFGTTPTLNDPSYWKELWDKLQEEDRFGIMSPNFSKDKFKLDQDDRDRLQRVLNGTEPVITTENLNTLTTIKLPGIDKIRWRYRNHESVKSTRWNRNHTKVAEFYWFWEIICRNAKMYIPLEEQYNTKSGLLEIPVPHLELRFPLPMNES